MGGLLSLPLNDAVFPKQRPSHDAVALQRYGFEVPEDGLYALKRGDEGFGGATIACFHGNLETTSNSIQQWLFIRCRALIGFEYPGYGKRASEDINQDALLSDISTWIETLEKLKLSQKVFACGRSLGSFAALRFALSMQKKNIPCQGIVLVSPMLTAAATKVSSPWYQFVAPIDLLDNESAARQLSPKVPVLILHGEKDTVVPAWNSEALARAFTKNGNAVTRKVIANRGHNDLMKDVEVDIQHFLHAVAPA